MFCPTRAVARDCVLVLASLVATVLAVPVQAQPDLSGSHAGQRFIVKYRNAAASTSARTLQAASTALGRSTRLESLRHTAGGAEVVRASRKLDRVETESLLRRLAADPNVEYVEPDTLLHATMTPNDPRYAEQWGYSGPYGIKANLAWDRATGAGVVVAVVDSGITAHSDLAASVLPGYDFISDPWVANDGDGRDGNAADAGDGVLADECDVASPARASLWHGTHVAGTVAAVTGNGKGVAGVAPGARIVPVRVMGRCGAYMSDVADGIVWASGGGVAGVPANGHPAEVVNISLGGVAACSATLQNAIDTAMARGTTVVVAAGNENADAAGFTPANCNNVITVGAITATGARASFSNHGAHVDIAAPGTSILSTINSGTMAPAGEAYGFLSGTSMAAPHVSGVVALLQSAATTPKTPAQVEALLKATAMPFPTTPSQPVGAGIVDARAAVEAVMSPPLPTTPLANRVAITGLGAALRSERMFTLDVPPGATGLKFVTSGGTGDADLYVKSGSAPTTTSYQCRSSRIGNAESCSFSAPQAGTYYVMVRAYAAYAGLSLSGSYTAIGGRNTYTNGSNYTILDRMTVESPITVQGRSGMAPRDASVTVAIRHTYQGDLRVDLVAPDGSIYNLHNRTGGSADNIARTVALDLSNEPLAGTWKLRVYDAARGDTGYIDQWSISF